MGKGDPPAGSRLGGRVPWNTRPVDRSVRSVDRLGVWHLSRQAEPLGEATPLEPFAAGLTRIHRIRLRLSLVSRMIEVGSA
jgi:hypothetical protein